MSRRVVRLLVPGTAVLAVLSACARPGAPEGGPVPETPLRIVETRPEAMSVVEPFSGSVEIDFARRVSERPARGTFRDGVVVSPRTGSVEVRHRRRGLEIRMEGGFRERTIYRVTVLPVFRDLFQNDMGEPFDLFFSTGPEFEPNLLGGLVTDRLTLEDVGGARVDARAVEGGPTHSTVTDEEGIFAFPYLPSGRYRVVAYEDLNRNREPDFPEPQDSLFVEVSRGDTLIVTELALLAPDTTAAEVVSAEAVDSMAVEVSFDDHLDPEESLEDVRARIVRDEDGEPGPEVVEILHRHEWEARVAEEAEREEPDPPDPEDPDAPDPEVPDPDPDLPDLPRPDPEVPEAEPDTPPEDEPVRPGREIVLVLDRPLEPEVAYRALVENVTNINGVPDGGGEAGFTRPAPPEEEPPEEEPPEEDPPDEDPPAQDPPREAPPG